MAVALRLLLCSTALLVSFRHIEGKPFFDGGFWCDLFCDDDDYDTSVSTTTSMEDLLDSFFDCNGCTPNRKTTTSTTVSPLQPSQGFNLNLPPSPVGVNLTMQNAGGSWFLNFLPWLPGTPMPPPAAPAAPTAPAAAPAAGNATAANATAPAA